MTIEDDIEWDNDNEDTQAITVMMTLTTSCIVMKEHIDKRKQRQKKKKGGHPFTISRQRMSILLIQQLLPDPYFKWSYHFSHTEIKNLIQCIDPHFVVSTNEKKTALNGLIPMETKLLVSIRFLQVVVHMISFHYLVLDTLHISDAFGQLLMQLTKHQT